MNLKTQNVLGEINLDVNTSFTFKVMSYNVLAQTLLEGHMYLYKNHDRRALGWARRWGLIYEEIKDENPEVWVKFVKTVLHYSLLIPFWWPIVSFLNLWMS